MKNEWIDFTNDFDYQKTLYDVLLPNGEIVLRCYPNCGFMNSDNGRVWDTTSNIKVRESLDFWGDSETENDNFDSGMGTTPQMWQFLSETIAFEVLPASLITAIYALKNGEAKIVVDFAKCEKPKTIITGRKINGKGW